MKFTETPIKGNYLINLELREDSRGFFSRFFCEKEFAEKGLNTSWAQINNSLSKEVGTLRGLHLQQPPYAEVKLVRCIQGAIWDVVVDVRKDSESYGKWFAAELNAQNRTMMYVPRGFAHGFITLKPDTEILYLVSTPYNPSSESTLKWNDPFHSIEWPLQPTVISDKDADAEPWNDYKAIVL